MELLGMAETTSSDAKKVAKEDLRGGYLPDCDWTYASRIGKMRDAAVAERIGSRMGEAWAYETKDSAS